MDNKVYVTDSRFGAAADDITNDRKAIQAAIDYVYSLGGGTVVFDKGKTFLSTGIIIKSGVTLLFEDGAVLHQAKGTDGYVKIAGNSYEEYTPVVGHNYSEKIKWSHTWYKNYPFIFAPEGSHDFAVKGNGTIRMCETDEPEKVTRCCPIGFFRAENFEISDITINNYHGYAMMPFTSRNGLIKNVKIFEWDFGNGDGICLMNCRDIRITGCKMYTGDDSVYIFSSYRDPRKSEWWNSDNPQPSENIEIDSCDLKSHRCKAFGMILWGAGCPDKEEIEVRNINIHDNHFVSMGNWLYNPYIEKEELHPVTDVKFYNNKIETIEENFFETKISSMSFFRSMDCMLNTSFSDGRVYWMYRGAEFHKGEESFASLKGSSEIYQGIFVRSGEKKLFGAEIDFSGNECVLFVRNSETKEVLFSKTVSAESESEIEFTVPESANYDIGIKCENQNEIKVKNVFLAGNNKNAFAYEKVTKEDGKVLYHFGEETHTRRNQLKMYRLPYPPVQELTLPEGYSFSHFDVQKDKAKWHECIQNGLCDGITTEQAYQNEIVNFHDIVPEEDIWFLDYHGEHIGTATGFVYSETNIGDMHMVGIRTDFRKKGLAKYLSYIIIKYLQQKNVRFISLTSGEGRPAAVRSYLSAGFLPVEYAEGMQERWEKFMYKYNIDSLPMLREDGSFYKMIYKRK